MKTIQLPYFVSDPYDGQDNVREADLLNDEITDITEDQQYDWYNFYPDGMF